MTHSQKSKKVHTRDEGFQKKGWLKEIREEVKIINSGVIKIAEKNKFLLIAGIIALIISVEWFLLEISPCGVFRVCG
jgi:hypothetical protein